MDASSAANLTVDPDVLAARGLMLLQEVGGVRTGAAGVLYPMAWTTPDFAGNGMAEGATFAARHEVVRASLVTFLGDVVNGLTTLGNAALAISTTYDESDGATAADVGPIS